MTRRVKLLLGVLAAALLLSLASRLRTGPAPAPTRGPSRAERALAARGARGPAEAGKADAVVELRLADLEPKSGEFRPGRNPFAFHAEPPPPPPPPPPGPSPEALAALEAERRRQEELALAAAVPPRPVPPPIDFAYLGSFGSPERRVAVFRNGAGGLVNALVGDVLEGKFRLVAIGYESVGIEFVGFPDLPPEQVAVGEEEI